MNLESMLEAMEGAEADVQAAKKAQMELKGQIIRDMLNSECYDFITINVGKMRQCLRPRPDRIRRDR